MIRQVELPTGVQLEYAEQGDPGGVPVLLLHGAIGPGGQNPVLVEVRNEVSGLSDPIDAEFAREFQAGTTEKPLTPSLLDMFVAESLKLPAWLWRRVFDGFMAIDMTAELGAVESPVLLIWGDRDVFDTRAEQEWLLRTIQDSSLTVYEGAGHAVHWERPERFAADLAAFALAQGRRRTMSSSETSGRSKRALTA
jgi:non-heme chloroperoxidase